MRYQPNRRGVRQIMNTDDMQAFILAKAEEGADYARSRAPVRSGAYRDSIRAEPDRAGDRVGATITATVPYAQRVEQARHVFAGIVDVIER